MDSSFKFNLLKLGFEEKEADVYLSCLSLGTGTVSDIATRSAIKRPTCYVVLESLMKKGFVSSRKNKKHILYTAVHPKKLQTDVQNNRKRVEEILPDLMLLYKDNSAKPSVQVFEGVEAMSHIYTELMESVSTGQEALLYGQFEHTVTHQDFEKDLDDWVNFMKNHKHKSKEIIYADRPHERKYLKQAFNTKNKNPNHQIKIFKDIKLKLMYDNLIFDNKLVMFSTGESLFALVIENKEIADSYRAMFEYAWSQAREVTAEDY